MDDDGHLLIHFYLTNKISGSPVVAEACISLARTTGASVSFRPAFGAICSFPDQLFYPFSHLHPVIFMDD